MVLLESKGRYQVLFTPRQHPELTVKLLLKYHHASRNIAGNTEAISRPISIRPRLCVLPSHGKQKPKSGTTQ